MSGARTLILPYPPVSGNHQHGRHRGRVFTRREIVEYREQVGCRRIEQGVPLTRGPVEVELDLCPPDTRRRDGDNAEKVVFDALARAGVIEDDSLIRRHTTTWGAPEREGRVVVTVKEFQASGRVAELPGDDEAGTRVLSRSPAEASSAWPKAARLLRERNA